MRTWAAIAMATCMATSYALGAAKADSMTPSTQPTAPTDWKLVFSDEFNHSGPPDPALWSYETGMLRNHEAQYYTDHRLENARVENGSLLIEARHEDFTAPSSDPARPPKSAHYTSASLQSRQSWLYGRFEIRARVPVGRGAWPALWFLSDRIRDIGWPASGEIDLMEEVGFDPARIHQSIHTAAYNHPHHTQKTAVTPIPDLATEFHVYAMDWSPEKIDMFIDGEKRFSFPNEHKSNAEWPFSHPFHLKLNLAIGGDWGGQKGIDDSSLPQQFLIDYVRVYQPR